LLEANPQISIWFVNPEKTSYWDCHSERDTELTKSVNPLRVITIFVLRTSRMKEHIDGIVGMSDAHNTCLL